MKLSRCVGSILEHYVVAIHRNSLIYMSRLSGFQVNGDKCVIRNLILSKGILNVPSIKLSSFWFKFNYVVGPAKSS